MAHLAALLFWPDDLSPQQRATRALVGLLERSLRLVAPVLRFPGVPGLVIALDGLVREGLFGEAVDAQT